MKNIYRFIVSFTLVKWVISIEFLPYQKGQNRLCQLGFSKMSDTCQLCFSVLSALETNFVG